MSTPTEPNFEAAFYEALHILRDVEEYAKMRLQDWGDTAAQEVLDCINREGEWVQS